MGGGKSRWSWTRFVGEGATRSVFMVCTWAGSGVDWMVDCDLLLMDNRLNRALLLDSQLDELDDG